MKESTSLTTWAGTTVQNHAILLLQYVYCKQYAVNAVYNEAHYDMNIKYFTAYTVFQIFIN